MARKNIRIGQRSSSARRQAEYLPVAKDVAKLFVFHLGQRGIHHQDQPDGTGMLVVPIWKRLMNPSTPGIRYPAPTPTAMARKIQRVR